MVVSRPFLESSISHYPPRNNIQEIFDPPSNGQRHADCAHGPTRLDTLVQDISTSDVGDHAASEHQHQYEGQEHTVVVEHRHGNFDRRAEFGPGGVLAAFV